ncbi:MAG: DUF4861 domain-containing protein [Acidobacteriia bacterium]|nr:DUF4861 domain-containing protein [Terriglobia bacterium]
MARIIATLLIGLSFMAAAGPAAAASSSATVMVKNPIDLARSSETIVLDAAELRRILGVKDVRRVHVRDARSAQDLLVQAVDLNDDGTFDQLLFQTDIGPSETRKFVLTVGEVQIAAREQFKAYGRFVRERRDDFAWENDRIAHRMYGAALETWAQEPLTSSAVDVWTKRTRKLVINDWYMVDDYHHDHGEGADLYSAGSSRGCGGDGLWAGGRLYPSANFRDTRVLANGPIRVMFELVYPAWQAGGVRVSMVKRITLDAGQNLDRFESHYTVESGSGDLAEAIGIRKTPAVQLAFSRDQGTLRAWEALQGDDGQLGCAVIVDPASVIGNTVDIKNYLVTAKMPPDKVAVYYAGFGWNKSGDFKGPEEWDRYVAQFATRLRSPLQVSLAAQ